MTKYVFHSEKSKTTCKECLKYDKKVYYDKDKIPKLPIHPNCKCYIETAKENAEFSDMTKERSIQHISKYEGYSSIAYKNKGDVWTIGYGHTKGVKAGDKVTKEEAKRLLKNDFSEHSKALKYITAPLSNNQKIVLASLAYNMGIYGFKNSDLVKILNTDDYNGAAKELEKYIRNNSGVIQPGLVTRRKEESKLFLTPD